MRDEPEQPTPATKADETLQRIHDYCASIHEPNGSSNAPSHLIGVGLYVATTRILEIINGSSR